MKLACVATAAALAMGSAMGAEHATHHTLNRTEAGLGARRLFATVTRFRMVGVDIIGKDVANEHIATPLACYNYCLDVAAMPGKGCGASTWTNYQDGTCWAKDTGLQTTPTTPKAEAESYFLIAGATSSFIWSDIKQGFDMVGFDIANTRRGMMDECKSDCVANKDCYAVTWTDYEGGACWLKSRASGYVAKAGAKSAYVAKKG